MGRTRRGFDGFKTFSERGAWVEMMFMAAASFRGYRVLKPWGDGLPYDVAVEAKGGMLRIQGKSTSHKAGAGYLCDFHHCSSGPGRRYRADEVDVFVGYVVPHKAWYILPAHKVTGREGTAGVPCVPVGGVRQGARDVCKPTVSTKPRQAPNRAEPIPFYRIGRTPVVRSLGGLGPPQDDRVWV